VVLGTHQRRGDALKRAAAFYLKNKAVVEDNELMAITTRTLPPASESLRLEIHNPW
jgi:hypothetical protein